MKFVVSVLFCDIFKPSMEKIELNNFYNEGFGWVCKSCEKQKGNKDSDIESSRLLREGEAESKTPRLSNKSLAKWFGSEKQILICPNCNIKESLNY